MSPATVDLAVLLVLLAVLETHPDERMRAHGAELRARYAARLGGR